MELGLKGRTAVISGGSKGIGKSIAKGLAAEGRIERVEVPSFSKFSQPLM